MANLVGNHIGLRKLAGFASDIARAKAPFEVLKKACVEIDLLVVRTIGQVLFSGIDTNGDVGLWVTNGTANGTHELTNISNANVNGLHPNAKGGVENGVSRL
jgi:ELWxxDGT repeat protein